VAGKQVKVIANGTSAIEQSVRQVIARHPSVILAYLFGSQVRGEIGPLSDIDIALLLDDADETGTVRSDLRSAIADALGQERVDVVFLNRAAVELAYAIILNGELVYERDAYTRVEYEAKIMSLYCDYLPVLRAQRGDILRGDEHETRVQRYREALGRTERTLSAFRSAEG
jgi:predicted nucleotidyltransferase